MEVRNDLDNSVLAYWFLTIQRCCEMHDRKPALFPVHFIRASCPISVYEGLQLALKNLLFTFLHPKLAIEELSFPNCPEEIC